jgi:hypothetical protein
MIRYATVFFCFCFLLIGSFVHAQSDEFEIRTRIGEDTTPPTTPTLISAIPVATTQIDLEWSASTDDFLLGGYRVFRDAAQIATTTLTAYSDTGLTASTTYTYYVQAFDYDVNVSSSSNSIATTTFALPATSTPPTDSPNQEGSAAPVKLLSLDIDPGIHTVKFAWKTNRYAQFELQWGRTTSYELGFVRNELFKQEHSTSITDLEPGTTYEYQLVGYNRQGTRFVLSQGQFVTQNAPDDAPPTNVSNLRAVLLPNDDIKLTWLNPSDPDFAYVRILRSHLFYPVDPYDGFVAYQGYGETYLDKKAGSRNDVQYYTVFSYDHNGNISSGAIIGVSKRSGTVIVEPTQTQTPDAPDLALNFTDLEVLQNQKHIEGNVINADLPVLLRIAYEKLPEHLKAITVTLVHPQDAQSAFSVLLRINKDKTYYESVIAPLHSTGIYPVTLSVYDYQVQKIFTAEGTFDVQKFESSEEFGVPLRTGVDTLFKNKTVWLLLLLLLLLILLLLLRRLLLIDAQQSFHRAGFAVLALLCTAVGVGIYMSRAMFDTSATQGVAAVSVSALGNGTILFIALALVGLAIVLFLRRK